METIGDNHNDDGDDDDNGLCVYIVGKVWKSGRIRSWENSQDFYLDYYINSYVVRPNRACKKFWFNRIVMHSCWKWKIETSGRNVQQVTGITERNRTAFGNQWF